MGTQRKVWLRTRARRVQRAFARIVAAFDPSPYPRGRELSWSFLDQVKRTMSQEEAVEAQQALDILTTGILRAPWHYLPEANIDRYDGSACIDATPLPLYARGRGVHETTASSDPDGGFYIRSGDHDGDRVRARKAIYALDLHLIVGSQPLTERRRYIPALPIAMTASRPGADPAGAARRMLTTLALFGHKPRYLAGDNLYTLAAPTSFQLPATELGWTLVLPYPKGHTGRQGSTNGAPLVEGRWCCPAIPEVLISATEDLRAKQISTDMYQARILARDTYALRARETAQPGQNQRFSCPAAGAHPTAKCVLKPNSEQPRLIHEVTGTRLDLRPRITPSDDLKAGPATVCRQESITIRPDEGARYRQQLAYGSPAHTTVYYSLREAQEGLHGYAKSDTGEALHAKGRRRIRGLAANSLIASLLRACSGIRKVKAFLNDAVPDQLGVLHKVERPRSQRRPGPPGTETN